MVDARTALAQSDTLRLIWPQWQGAGETSVRSLLPELPYGEARRVYALGTRVLTALLPEHAGPTEIVPVSDEPTGEEVLVTKGVESRAQILAGIRDAREAIARHDAPRILTLGGTALFPSSPSPSSPPVTETTWPSSGSTPTRHRHLALPVPRLPRHGGLPHHRYW